MKFSNFVIELRSFNLSEVSDIPDFRDVSTVANITEDEFLESRLVQRLGDKENNFRKEGIINNLRQPKFKFHNQKQKNVSTPKPARTPIIPCGSQTIKRPRGRPRMQTSTPIVDRSQPKPRTVHFDYIRVEPVLPPKPKPPKQTVVNKVKRLPRTIPNLKAKTANLLDLIPVDVDCLGLEMDKLSLTSPELHESEYDSVSCLSSDSEYDSFQETHDCIVQQSQHKQVPKQHIQDTGRPGVKLDWAIVGPPSKQTISNLPATEVYKCDRPGCGFTTSNLTNRKLHSCTRWTDDSPIDDDSDWSSSHSS